MIAQRYLLFAYLVAFLFVSEAAFGLEKPGEELQEVGVSPDLGTKVPLDLHFRDEEDRDVTLRELVPTDRPAILIPAYYDCPRLCGLVLNAFVKLANRLPLKIGTDYKVITVSIDTSETASHAASAAKEFRPQIADAPEVGRGWSFLTGTSENVAPLMKSIGFHYRPDGQEFAHSTAIMILTPQGEISQYFTDINFSPWDTKLALVDASQGRIGSAIDHFLLFCYRFDVTKGKYTWAAWNFVRAGVLLCVLASCYLVFIYSRRLTSP